MGLESAQLTARERRYRRNASLVSLVVGLVLLVAKFWAFNVTNSKAVFSDALESIVNVVAAALALFVVAYSAKPVDQDHPYGHGKAEYFSATFEGGLITFAAVLIVIQAVEALLAGETLHQLTVGIYIVASAGLINLVLGLYLLRRGGQNGSIALRASGHHVISDFWTSVGMTGGLIVVNVTGWVWMDSVLAIVVGGLLAWNGTRLVRSSVGSLMDKEDVEVLEQLSTVFSRFATNGIIQIHQVKVIRSGWYHHIDAHIVLPEYWTVKDVHDKIVEFEKNVIKEYDYAGEMNFHPDPCRQAYCRVCDVENCPIRLQPFESRMPVKLEHIRSPYEPSEYQ